MAGITNYFQNSKPICSRGLLWPDGLAKYRLDKATKA